MAISHAIKETTYTCAPHNLYSSCVREQLADNVSPKICNVVIRAMVSSLGDEAIDKH
jgi:hypothetical protein